MILLKAHGSSRFYKAQRFLFSQASLPSETLYILDGTHMLHRAYHGHDNPDKFTVGKDDYNSYGGLVAMTMSLARFIRDIRPKYLAIALDSGRTTFRNDIYADYKSHRKETPASLRAQLSQSKFLFEILGCRCFSEDGYEADDIMASLGVWAKQRVGGLMRVMCPWTRTCCSVSMPASMSCIRIQGF